MVDAAFASPSISPMTGRLAGFRRLVVKIGSALLVEGRSGTVRREWLAAMAADIARLAAGGTEMVVVSSGAIALGRGALRLKAGPLRLEESQAAAAVGQIGLAGAWADALAAHRLTAAQVLVTFRDTEDDRRQYLNARATLGTLLKLRAVPVINENDTVATGEIKYGDNDRLAARVATMEGADGLVLLSDIDGLYTAPPATDPGARLVPVVDRVTPDIEAMAGAAGSELSRGGMKTKIEAAKIATGGGTGMFIASGKVAAPLSAIDGGGTCTWFRPASTPAAAYKRWIAGHLEPRGAVVVDDGARRALAAGKSLLPAGVTAVEGDFARGDPVYIRGTDGRVVGRGLVAYDRAEAQRILGEPSSRIEEILGYPGRAAMIHRDDMALDGEG